MRCSIVSASQATGRCRPHSAGGHLSGGCSAILELETASTSLARDATHPPMDRCTTSFRVLTGFRLGPNPSNLQLPSTPPTDFSSPDPTTMQHPLCSNDYLARPSYFFRIRLQNAAPKNLRAPPNRHRFAKGLEVGRTVSKTMPHHTTPPPRNQRRQTRTSVSAEKKHSRTCIQPACVLLATLLASTLL